MKWIKPNGNKIETNDLDDTIAYCVSLGWVKDDGNSSASGKGKPSENTRSSKRGTARG